MTITVIQKLARQKINSLHKIIERNKWSVKRPVTANLVSDWGFTDIVLHHSGDFGEKDPKSVQVKSNRTLSLENFHS